MSIMRLTLLLPLILGACTPAIPEAPTEPLVPIQAESTQEDQGKDPQTTESGEQANPVSPISEGPINSPEFTRSSLRGISIEAVTFDSRSHFLAVADQVDGPGSQWPDCRAAGQANSGIASINAGFFTPEGAPLGKVIASGTNRGAINRASSLGSGFYVRNGGSMALIRRERFHGGDQALQSGPWLIENRRSVDGLSTKQSSARSFVASDGASRWIIARTSACSLSDLAKALEGQSIAGIPLKTALNLDGGRSSEIWVSNKVQNGPHFQRPFWNKPVRNYLVLRPRH